MKVDPFSRDNMLRALRESTEDQKNVLNYSSSEGMRSKLKRFVRNNRILHRYFAPGREGFDLWFTKLWNRIFGKR